MIDALLPHLHPQPATPSTIGTANMVYYETAADIRADNASLVGRANYLSFEQSVDIQSAFDMAKLQPGEKVLDLGCAGGRLTTMAKKAVGSGLVVGLDIVPGFLATDAPDLFAESGLTVAPAGTLEQQVHLVLGDVTDSGIANILESATGQPSSFNVIFLIHVFDTVLPKRRRILLKRLESMLAPGGRMIVSMSARFTDQSDGLELQLPIQFRNTPHAEAMGGVTFMKHYSPLILFPGLKEKPPGCSASPVQRPECIVRTGTDRLWDAATEQAEAAAEDVGLRLVQTARIGASDWALEHHKHGISPEQLARMNTSELQEWVENQANFGFRPVQDVMEALAHRQTAGWASLSQELRDYALAESIREIYLPIIEKGQVIARADVLAGRSSVLPTHAQVGVIAELQSKGYIHTSMDLDAVQHHR